MPRRGKGVRLDYSSDRLLYAGSGPLASDSSSRGRGEAALKSKRGQARLFCPVPRRCANRVNQEIEPGPCGAARRAPSCNHVNLCCMRQVRRQLTAELDLRHGIHCGGFFEVFDAAFILD